MVTNNHPNIVNYNIHTRISIIYATILLSLWVLFKYPIIFLFIGMLPLSFIIIMQYPAFFCICYIILSYFRYHELYPLLANIGIMQLLGLIMISYTIGLIMLKSITLYWSKELSVFSLFSLIIVISALFSDNASSAYYFFSDHYVKTFLMFFIIVWSIRLSHEFSAIIRLIIISGIILSGLSLLTFFHADPILGIISIENTMLGDANDFSLILLLPISFSGALILTKRTLFLDKLMSMACISLGIVAIIYSGSRGGLIGLLSIGVIYIFLKFKSKLLITLLLISVIVSGAFFFGTIERPIYNEQGKIEQSAQGRINAWIVAIKMSIHRPLGVGVGNFVNSYHEYNEADNTWGRSAHSIWFEILGKTGFPGFISFVILICLCINKAWRSLSYLKKESCRILPNSQIMAQGLFVGLISFCVSGSFLSQALNSPLYIIMGLIIAHAHFLHKNKLLISK